MTAAVGQTGKEMADVTLDGEGAIPGSMAGRITEKQGSQASAQDWLDTIEKSRLTLRYYATMVLIVLQEMFEFYDFFLVGYLVSVLAPGTSLMARAR